MAIQSTLVKKCNYSYSDSITKALGHDLKDAYDIEGLTLECDKADVVYLCDRCNEHVNQEVTSINNKDNGLKYVSMCDDFMFSSFHDETYLEFKVYSLTDDYAFELLYSFQPDYGRFVNKTFKLNIESNDSISLLAYSGENYSNGYTNTIKINRFTDSTKKLNHVLEIQIPYADYYLSKSEVVGMFGFYPIITSGIKYFYEQRNPYVLDNYSETWLKLNSKNNIYYDTKYQTNHVDDWVRPDLTGSEHGFAYSISETTIERTIVAGLIAQEKGAQILDVHIETLLDQSLINETDLAKIFTSFTIPCLALNYDGNKTQQLRLDQLEIAVKASASGVDFQGFMYHTGSTIDTQTKENIEYWESLGYDMSFVSASPKETVIDKTEDAQQIEYIKKIHSLGAKVLQSAHTNVVFTKKQALALGKFMDRRGVDIIKLVAYGFTRADLDAVREANIEAYYDPSIHAKYSIHTNKAPLDIDRIIGPLFYHTYMCFSYYNMVHLQMMMDLYNSGIVFDDSLSVAQAVNLIKGKSIDPQLNSYIYQCNGLSENNNYVFGASSTMSDRWQNKNTGNYIQLRDSEGTNAFSIRGITYHENDYSNDFVFETALTASFKPYTKTSSRIPKLGLFIGSLDNMIAFTYDYKTDSNGIGSSYAVSVRYNNNSLFTFDKFTVTDQLDSLVNVDATKSISADIVNGDKLSLKVTYKNGDVIFDYKVNDEEYQTLISLSYNEIKDLFSNDDNKNTHIGNIFECYMGSKSTGVVNWINFDNN